MLQTNVAVLGPVPRDQITTYEGRELVRFGASLHTAIVLSKLLPQGKVSIASHIKSADEARILQILEPFNNIDTAQLSSQHNRGDVVQLTFTDQNARHEIQTEFMPPILPADVSTLLHCDAFVCVPITDYEVPLQTLQYIKSNSKGSIIFDAHGPTTSLAIDGRRFNRYWADIDLWLPYIDVLKMNLLESKAAWQYPTTAVDDNSLDLNHLRHFARHCINLGVKLLVVTLDERGAIIFYTDAAGHLESKLVAPKRVHTVLDTTGCGDSFAGGLAFGILQQMTFENAVKIANLAGALRTQGNGFNVFNSLENYGQMLLNYNEILHLV
ncbi:carbohydrate kinase family protein [bacterium]|nr:carbohydrate kinase family protein [bacterium]